LSKGGENRPWGDFSFVQRRAIGLLSQKSSVFGRKIRRFRGDREQICGRQKKMKSKKDKLLFEKRGDCPGWGRGREDCSHARNLKPRGDHSKVLKTMGSGGGSSTLPFNRTALYEGDHVGMSELRSPKPRGEHHPQTCVNPEKRCITRKERKIKSGTWRPEKKGGEWEDNRDGGWSLAENDSYIGRRTSHDQHKRKKKKKLAKPPPKKKSTKKSAAGVTRICKQAIRKRPKKNRESIVDRMEEGGGRGVIPVR